MTPFLLLSAATCASAAASFKWDFGWLPALAAISAISAVWMGRGQPLLLRCVVCLTLLLPAWKWTSPWRARSPEAADAAVISALVSSEETTMRLGPALNALSKALFGLRLPGPGTENLFTAPLSVSDLRGVPPGLAATNADAMTTRAWPVEESLKDVAAANLWRPLLDAVESFDHAKVFIIDGDHPSGDMSRYDANCGFEGLAKMKSGGWLSLRGKLKISWKRVAATSPPSGAGWRICVWKTEQMECGASPRRLFVEALDSAMRSPSDLARARHSDHFDATLKYYREGMKTPPHPYFAPISANQKEGVAVADIDGDGFDDIYIMVRIGTNMFLHNNGDGTFTEEGARRGLALPGHTTCAIFADFDNDGDLDVMLGRSLLRTAYLENRGGRFFQHPSPKHFPMAVISMSAADYNGDGLLDLYLCTYRPAAPAGASPAGGVAQIADGGFDWPDEFLSPEDAKEFRRRLADQKQKKAGNDNQFPDVLDQIGPPNVLLVNRGRGWFEVAPENRTVGLWRNSLQATWCDYNQDGRPDLYIANDWAVDNLLRNDGPAGFTDVTSELGLSLYGFGMGASWGDYDNDGRDDLYVSNMHSAAGRRITARIPGLNKTYIESAAGNWLYHNEADGRFKQVAGLEAPAMKVMNAGWSWGGCFADFDNDGFLDLYVLSGYFTAPSELSSDIDIESNLWRTTVRSDERLARPSFRFSPEWKRTRPPDSFGPEIDARLGGVERRGDQMLVHSLNGNERNHYFANRGGRSFEDLSALSGLDNPADSRGFALLDYDRDGWQDVALVNANQPLFNLYHNEMPAAGLTAGMIAIRFVGGNRTPVASTEYACRDGYGARVVADLGDTKLTREHRCGDGWSTQNSATMILGIGARASVPALSVRWPSGRKSLTQAVPEGTLLTVYENPADSPTGIDFVRAPYRKSKAGTR